MSSCLLSMSLGPSYVMTPAPGLGRVLGNDSVKVLEWIEAWSNAAAGVASRMWTWLSGVRPDYLAAWATLATAWATLALVFFTYRLASLTQVLARETRATREPGERADVQCAIQPHEEHLNIAELVIANLGTASATQMVLTYGPTMSGNKDVGTRTIKLSRLLPGARIHATVGSYVHMHTKIFQAKGMFRDRFGQWPIDYEQELGGWFGLSRVSGHPEYKTAEALSKMADIMDKWTRSGVRLEVNAFSARDHEREEQRLWQVWGEAESPDPGQPPGHDPEPSQPV